MNKYGFRGFRDKRGRFANTGIVRAQYDATLHNNKVALAIGILAVVGIFIAGILIGWLSKGYILCASPIIF